MTLGLWLLGLTAMARSSSEPFLAPSGQGAVNTAAFQKPKGQKPAPATPKKVVSPPPPVEEAPALPRFRNLGLTIGQRVDALVEALKPDERSQFLCISQAAISRLGIGAFDWSQTASDDRFPRPIGLAASFDVDLANRIATLRALEKPGAALYSPITVVRDPRWGMTADTFGEDPLLVGSLAAAQVAELRRLGRVGSVGILGSAGIANLPSLPLSSSDLEDFVLLPSRLAFSANSGIGLWIDPAARVGESALFSADFIAGTVRKAWGFRGPLISAGSHSDAVTTPTPPKSTTGSSGSAESPSSSPAPSPKSGAIDALLSGCDLFSAEDCKALVEAAKTNADVAKAMDRALRTVLETEIRAGIFDPPKAASTMVRPTNEVSQLQARAAAESMVLLKNQGDLLPLRAGYKTIAVIGPNADNPLAVLGGKPSESENVLTPLGAIKAALGSKTKVLYDRGTGLLGRDDLETVPKSALVSGMSSEYYDTANFSGTPVTKHEENLDLAWKGDPVEGIKSKHFSAVWTGALVAPVSGTYGLGVTVDGGVRVYLDDNLIIDDWQDGPTRTKTVPVDLDKDAPFYVVRVEYARGAGSGSLRLVWSLPEDAPYRTAIEAAIKSDVVILVLGLDPSLEGPNMDRREIELPDAQEGLLRQIVGLGRPTVLVLLNGGPVSSAFAKDNVAAILEAWYPGQAGSTALAGVLTGSVNPSGKLPITIYQSSSQIPNLHATDALRGYRESLYRPLFPFGSGLSYTHFAFSGLDAPLVVDGSKQVTVGFTVKNPSKRAGEEVVQLYMSWENPTPGNPRVALRRFRRVQLNPGASMRVVFVLFPEDFQLLQADHRRRLVTGSVRISVGGNQPMDDQPPTLSATVRTKGS